MRPDVLTLAPLALALATGSGAGTTPQPRPAAHYPLDEGGGAVAHDTSGMGRNGKVLGGCRWADMALRFNGVDGYVDCGPAERLNLTRAATIEVWFNAEHAQGGLVNCSTGGGWGDERLVIAFNTYDPRGSRPRGPLMWCLADGEAHQSGRFIPPSEGTWTHVALAFDGTSVFVYQDGLLLESLPQEVTPEVGDAPLWLGRCLGLGKQYFHGLIAQVTLYDRALTEPEVLQHYRSEAKAMGLDVPWLQRPTLTSHFRPYDRALTVDADLRGMMPLPRGARIRVDLFPRGRVKSVAQAEAQVRDGRASVGLNAAGLSAGEYRLRATVTDARGRRIGKAGVERVVLTQPPQRAGAKVLNNLVAELLHVSNARSRREARWDFTNPRDGWVFIRSSARVPPGGKVVISVDGASEDDAVIVHTEDVPRTLEAMRFLPAGSHRLVAMLQPDSSVQRLVVRAVPELIFCKFQYNPHVADYGPYDWQFLEKHVLPHVNCIVGSGASEHEALVQRWKSRGGKWIVEVPATPYFEAMSAEGAFDYWSRTAGLSNPLLDGIIVDEFSGGDDPRYAALTESLRRIRRDDRFENKSLYPYCGSMYGADPSEEFIRTVAGSGYRFAWERYLREPRDEPAARSRLDTALTREMVAWQKAIPRCERSMILCFGYMSAPPESLDADPSVDYKVWMDMQFQHVATDPAFFGLYGLMEYTCGYADEETVRWAARLYRHYGIEGNTRLLSDRYGFKYHPAHLKNPDFEEGTNGWTVEPAEDGSVEARRMNGLSWLEGRYPRTRQGDTFLWMRRNRRRPNVVSQTIKNLKPGRLYSLRMFTADYRDLVAGNSVRRTHAISIRLDDVELLPRQCFQHVFPNCYSHRLGPFDSKHRAWMNYHVRLFRARAKTAHISISDWASHAHPGGPVGQEIALNFVQVQPYFAE